MLLVPYRPIVLLIIIVVLAGFVAGGCSSSKKKSVYEDSTSSESLEVPPDLTMPPNEGKELPKTASQYASVATETPTVTVLTSTSAGPVPRPLPGGVKLARDGAMRWLIIGLRSDQVWEQLKRFLTEQEYEIVVENRELGYLETDWRKYGTGKSGNWFSRALNSVSSGSTLDRYRFRIEADDSGRTLVFVAHHGKREVISGEDTDQTISEGWTWRPSDPQLEVEMMQRFAIFLGTDEKIALAAISVDERDPGLAQVVDKKGELWLKVDQVFFRTWRRTQIALDRMGFIITKQDRGAGEFFVTVPDDFAEQEQGGLSSLFGSKDKPVDKDLIIKLDTSGETTRLELLDSANKPRMDDLDRRILGELEKLLS